MPKQFAPLERYAITAVSSIVQMLQDATHRVLSQNTCTKFKTFIIHEPLTKSISQQTVHECQNNNHLMH